LEFFRSATYPCGNLEPLDEEIRSTTKLEVILLDGLQAEASQQGIIHQVRLRQGYILQRVHGSLRETNLMEVFHVLLWEFFGGTWDP